MAYVLLNKIQDQARKAVIGSLIKDNKALLQMATGTGKTETAKKILDSILIKEPNARILWLVHSNELLEQTANRILNSSPELNLGIFSGEVKCIYSQITIASVQTISRINNLKKFDKKDFQYIFVDEAHHSPASSWDLILKYFSNAKKFGFTATPYRPDGRTLEESFGQPVFELSFRDAQDKGLLAKDESYVILTNSVLAPSVTKEGEYSQRSLDRLFVSKDRNDIIVKSYIKYGRGALNKAGIKPKAVLYCVNSEHAKRMSEVFNARGVKAAFIVGDVKQLSAATRSEVYQQFRDTHDIEVLCTVNIFNEAIDIPDLSCAIMARPTRSNIVYSQQLGRAARILHGKKEKFIVLDYVDNTRAEFQGYTSSNLFKKGAAHTTTIVEYMTEADPVLVEQRIANVTKGIEEFENKFRRPRGHWTLKTLIIEALKYRTVSEWRKKDLNSYTIAHTSGHYTECIKHMTFDKNPKGYWTLGRCKQEAKKYKSKAEWLEKNSASYSISNRNNWMHKCVTHMKLKRVASGYWTLEKCKKLSLKYKTKSAWMKSHKAAYMAAFKKNWLKECCAHMPKISRTHLRRKLVIK